MKNFKPDKAGMCFQQILDGGDIVPSIYRNWL